MPLKGKKVLSLQSFSKQKTIEYKQMNFPLFIARKINGNEDRGRKVSKPAISYRHTWHCNWSCCYDSVGLRCSWLQTYYSQ